MIRKAVQRFSGKIMAIKEPKRDDDSTKSHRALATEPLMVYRQLEEAAKRPSRRATARLQQQGRSSFEARFASASG
jgi:hypothetical protein